ncbi:MAG: glutamate--tRNA ligase family protein [Planctomycetota bacterium]|nr:glutamate--tRNA ligase family protein [Planctomycetota bacterium]
MTITKRISRLAPSPTGALHLGNARTFLINWAIARQKGWQLLMRIEDLDGPRNKQGSIENTLEILQWLGIDFDGEVSRQSVDLTPYRESLQTLVDNRMAYACCLTRKDVEQAASAPHGDEHELRYPPELRPDDFQDSKTNVHGANYRFVTQDLDMPIEDELAGPGAFNPHREIGDFVIWTKRDEPAYQLAVVVDDARQGVTDVVRGIDLLPSAARQMLIYRALGFTPPRWWHVPLVLGEDGRRLAKRHGDTRLTSYRDHGVSSERVIGLLAHWCSASEPRTEISAMDFLESFSLEKLGSDPLIFTQEDEAWLRNA